MSPRRSLRTSQGQSERMSRVRFSAGFRTAGSRWSGRLCPSPSTAMSSGIETRAGMGSLGGGLPRPRPDSAYRRSRTAAAEGRRQMASLGPQEAASLSRARSAERGERAMSLRACRSRTSSGMSMRTALGLGPSPSRNNRLAKAVLSEVAPCRRTRRVPPPGRSMAASWGAALYHRRPMG